MTRAFTIVTAIIVLLAITSLLIDIGGFSLSPPIERTISTLDLIVVLYFVTETLLRLFVSRDRIRHLRSNWVSFFLILLLAMQIGLLKIFGTTPEFLGILRRLNIRSIAVLYVAVIKSYMLLHLLVQGVIKSYKIASLPLKPAQTVMLSFLAVILIGTLFLMMPRATYPQNRISPIDALFTATSATCVTGLIVRDTGSGFTTFGQIVILVLIQIGGLGLMTMTTFFALILGRGMGIRERVLMSDVLNTRTLSRIAHLIISILLLTFIFETFGAVLLYLSWSRIGAIGGTPKTIYYSVFHSVSAFCNAGFSLFSDSMMGFRDLIPVNLVMTTLIISGGLGFTVLTLILRTTFLNWPLRKTTRITLQAKLVLLVTILLIVLGFIGMLAVEWDGAFAGLRVKGRLLAAYFQSVTARTAGFNTVSIASLSNASLFLLICLMFIGASPGGTGGGIKTSTFAITVGFLIANLRGRGSVEMFGRRVPNEIVDKALSIVIISTLVLMVNGFLLLAVEGDHSPIKVIFELFSAFGTVGLSMGITPELSSLGKIIIMITMFTGRIGPLTLALALGERRRRGEFEYPSEEIMVG
jgi:trk system potassium uptake protein TrkH